MLASPPIAQRAMKVSGREPGFLQLNQTAACGGCDCLGAADHIEFAENAFDVGFDRAFADE
jgi:hypothetical protein